MSDEEEWEEWDDEQEEESSQNSDGDGDSSRCEERGGDIGSSDVDESDDEVEKERGLQRSAAAGSAGAVGAKVYRASSYRGRECKTER